MDQKQGNLINIQLFVLVGYHSEWHLDNDACQTAQCVSNRPSSNIIDYLTCCSSFSHPLQLLLQLIHTPTGINYPIRTTLSTSSESRSSALPNES